jgi:hypothetical protein
MWECFREALDPEIRHAFIGYCTRAEEPNWVIIPKELADSETCPHCGAPRVEAQAEAKATAKVG